MDDDQSNPNPSSTSTDESTKRKRRLPSRKLPSAPGRSMNRSFSSKSSTSTSVPPRKTRSLNTSTATSPSPRILASFDEFQSTTTSENQASEERHEETNAIASSDTILNLEPVEEDAQNVIVSVRVRPFNDREEKLNSTLIVKFEGKSVTIDNASNGKHNEFTYDHAFWSHQPSDSHFASQEAVYDKIGKPLLNWAIKGYNCCLFAYGQTGSGKSYSMMGVPGSKDIQDEGVIPRFGKELFSRMDTIKSQNSSVDFKVELSYFEIYSERIYDLLSPQQTQNKLRVREHPLLGPFVEGLKTFAVTSYKDVEGWMFLGGKKRATASTNMNATSSRSHAVFTLVITQLNEIEGEQHSKVSKVNLVDLAGSERSDVAGTSGVRLREGSAINRSLHTLGKVISYLADKSSKKKKKVFIPYRDSTLTWILRESLGGNSRTAMLATISPSSDNFDETLSTLRYAQRARQIVNEAHVNEDQNLKVIRELRAEISLLRQLHGEGGKTSLVEMQSLRKRLTDTEMMMEEMNKSWQEKLRYSESARREYQKRMESMGVKDVKQVDNRLPNLVNLNEDPQLSEMLIYVIKDGRTVVGSHSKADVKLNGVLILSHHCTINCIPSRDSEFSFGVSIIPQPEAVVYVNGHEIKTGIPQMLKHSDRLVIGNSHYFRLNIPRKVQQSSPSTPTDAKVKDFAFAKKELEAVQAQELQEKLEAEKKRFEEQHQAELRKKLEEERKIQLELLEKQKKEHERQLKELEDSRRKQEEEAKRRLESAEAAVEAAREEERAKMESLLREQELKLLKDKEQLQQKEEQARSELEQATSERNSQLEELKKMEQRLAIDVQQANATAQRRATMPTDEKMEHYSRLFAAVREANHIVKQFDYDVVFRLNADASGVDFSISVYNQSKLAETSWEIDNFEEKLASMLDLYSQFMAESGGENPEDFIGQLEGIIEDANDDWVPYDPSDTELSQQLFMAQTSQPSSRPSTARVEERLSIPLLCRYYIRNMKNSLNSRDKPPQNTDQIIGSVSSLKAAANKLRDAVEQGEDEPIHHQDEVKNASISSTLSAELICSLMLSCCSQAETDIQKELCQRLKTTVIELSGHVAEMLQGVHHHSSNMVMAGHRNVLTDISTISMICGELALASDVQDSQEDEEDFDDEELQQVGYKHITGQMVSLSDTNIQSLQTGIDDEILAAFDRGAHLHVTKSIKNCHEVLQQHLETLQKLYDQLSDKSNLDAHVLDAGIEVVETTTTMFEQAKRMQEQVSKLQDESTVSRTFYKKSYSKAKGILVELQELVDAATWLSDSFSMAARGNDDIEQVASYSKNLRQTIAHLLSATDSKLGSSGATTNLSQLRDQMNASAQSIYNKTSKLQKTCKTFGEGEHASMTRQNSLNKSGIDIKSPVKTRLHSISESSPSTPSNAASTDLSSIGTVRRRTMMIEQQANVLRIESELQNARKLLHDLNKSNYETDPNSSTSAI